MFALVDCNNFYASCERVFRPELRGKPIVVLSNNDGCVIARSNEAKQAGIPMGAPAFEYDPVFRQKKISVFSANFALYGDMSRRVMDLLGTFTPEMEIYSIDEAFLKFSDFEARDFYMYGLEMRHKVTQCTGIPISIGIASTKALSKVANYVAKKFPDKTANVYVIDSEEKRIKALKWLKIQDVWGIGRRHAKRLLAHNILTAYDFTQLSDQWVRKNMSVVGLRLKQDLLGIPVLDFETVQPKENIAVTRSFETNYTQLTELEERISTFAVFCAEKLRKQQACCNGLMVFLRTNRHRKDLDQFNPGIMLTLPFPTNSSLEVAKFAVQALHQIFRSGYEYKKAGVIVTDFTPEDQQQIKIFENSNARHTPLMQAVDKLNSTFGQQKVRLASQDSKRIWKMKQEKLSPDYTTKLSDVIVVNCK